LSPVIVGYLSDDPIPAFFLAAIGTWLFHSSVAFILLVAALAMRGLVPAELGIVLVLGSNLGGGLIAAMLSRTMPAPSRTVPLGNLVIRAIGAVIALLALTLFDPPMEMIGSTPALQIVHTHILFNVFLVLLGMPFAGLVTRSLESLQAYAAPPPSAALEDREASALDPDALGSPSRALANVTRAVVGVCETVEVMLKNIMELYDDPEREQIDALASLDDRVDRKHAAIKLYLARIPPEAMNEEEEQRTAELLDACVKLEQVGDIIVRNMLVHVRKKLDRGLTFTP